MIIQDGQYGSQYTLDLSRQKHEWFKSYGLPSRDPTHGKVESSCQWDFFITSNKQINFYSTPLSFFYELNEGFLYPQKSRIDVIYTRN
jgi:hypothetical protein